VPYRELRQCQAKDHDFGSPGLGRSALKGQGLFAAVASVLEALLLAG